MKIFNGLIEEKYISIDENDTINKALSLFGNSESLIIMKDKEYQGMLVKRELMRAKLSLNTKVHTLLTHAPKLTPTDSIEEIARLMVESGIYQLPVFEKEKLLGVVRAEDVLRQVSVEEISDQSISSIMNTKMITFTPGDSIGKAIKILREQDISHLPIIENNKLLGVLTPNDVIERVMRPEKKPDKWGKYGAYITIEKEKMQLPVKGIMQEQPTLFSPETPVVKVIEDMLKFNLHGVIIGKNQQIQGIVTKKDLLSILAGVTELEYIEIRFDKRIYEIEDFDKDEVEIFLKDSLLRKYEGFLREGYIYLSMKEHKEGKKNYPLITCQIRLSSYRGMMYATDKGHGVMQALKNTVNALEHQIRKVKRDKKSRPFPNKIIKE